MRKTKDQEHKESKANLIRFIESIPDEEFYNDRFMLTLKEFDEIESDLIDITGMVTRLPKNRSEWLSLLLKDAHSYRSWKVRMDRIIDILSIVLHEKGYEEEA